jgi:hypothetical protein
MSYYTDRLAKAAFEAARGNTSSLVEGPESAAAHMRNAAEMAPTEELKAEAMASALSYEAIPNSLCPTFLADYKSARLELKTLMMASLDAEEEEEEAAEAAYEAALAAFNQKFF